MKNSLLRTAAFLLVISALPALAHHSFYAEFDPNIEVKLEGEVVEMHFVNPHSWLEIAVINANGEQENWKVEGGSPNVMFRLGWNKNTLQPGTKVIVTGFGAKDGSHRASTRAIEFPDGRVLETGGSTQ